MSYPTSTPAKPTTKATFQPPNTMRQSSPRHSERRVLGEMAPNALLTPQRPGTKSVMREHSGVSMFRDGAETPYAKFHAVPSPDTIIVSKKWTDQENDLRTSRGDAILSKKLVAGAAPHNGELRSGNGSAADGRLTNVEGRGEKRKLAEVQGYEDRVAPDGKVWRKPKTQKILGLDDAHRRPVTKEDISNLSSTEEDTPGSSETEVEQRKKRALDSSAIRTSFSSLIDYDPEAELEAQRRLSEDCEDLLPAVREQASEMMITTSHAEILRLRLQVAIYKVRTNQIHTPLSQLLLPSQQNGSQSRTEGPASRLYSSPTTIPILPHSPSTEAALPPIPTITISPSKAASTRTTGIPKLLPAPILRPTAYSSRHITESYMPSSPPEPAGAETMPEDLEQRGRGPVVGWRDAEQT
ncbi:hypothetical protein LTR39_001958 [Cryomyces antarcticus]|nr:hypothetical protein LTR39_001958 [Cryomyces antarcticus]